MGLVSRFIRLVWGGDVDRALRPVLAVSLAGSIAGSSVYTYLGIWAIKSLGAAQSTLGFAYLIGAVLAGVTGYAGGHLSDRVGRRPMILAGWGFQAPRQPVHTDSITARAWACLRAQSISLATRAASASDSGRMRM